MEKPKFPPNPPNYRNNISDLIPEEVNDKIHKEYLHPIHQKRIKEKRCQKVKKSTTK